MLDHTSDSLDIHHHCHRVDPSIPRLAKKMGDIKRAEQLGRDLNCAHGGRFVLILQRINARRVWLRRLIWGRT